MTGFLSDHVVPTRRCSGFDVAGSSLQISKLMWKDVAAVASVLV
jgi:hypothetical protein